MADIFHEVDEEVRRERIMELARRFGPAILVLAVIIILGALAFLFWNRQQGQARERDATAFLQAQALLDAGKPKEAAQAFADVAQDSGGGYPALARFQEAEARLQSDDLKGAVAAYDVIAANASEPLFRELAQWKAALLLVGSAPREELEKRIAPLLDEHSAFRHSAREVRAAAALEANDRETAVAMLQQLSNDTNAPRDVQRRAREMLKALGVSPQEESVQFEQQQVGSAE